MLSDKETTRISKFLSLVLRHKPEEIGLALEKNGWVSVETLLEKMNAKGFRISLAFLQHVVETNKKKRFAFSEDGSKIRASQGHSLDVDLGYRPAVPPSLLYHGTAEKNLEMILKEGLQKQSRQHVHLSADEETAYKVGQRHGKPVVLCIQAYPMHTDGYAFYLSANGVWLTDSVPLNYIHYKKEAH